MLVRPNPALKRGGECGRTFLVQLDYDGQIALSSDDHRFDATNNTVTFDASNWDQKIIIKVTAVDDNLREDTLTSVITHSITNSQDATFNGVITQLPVKVYDNETQAAIVTETNGTTLVSKDGTTLTDSYSIRLTKAPTANVTITPVSDGQTTLEPICLTFTPDNWWIPQVVTVKGNPDYVPPSGSTEQPTKEFAAQPHLLNNLQGPLSITGGSVGPRALNNAILLPGELNAGLLEIGAQPPENEQIDTLNIFDDSSRQDKTGTLTSNRLTGLGLAPDLVFGEAGGQPLTILGGINYNAIEIFNLMLGEGNDTLTIESTLVTDAKHGGITVIHGGGNSLLNNGQVGGDTIIVKGGGGSASPLVVYGDTSQDGAWYAGSPSVANRTDNIDLGAKLFDQVGTADDSFRFGRANPFVRNGNDVIDATALFANVPTENLPSVGLTVYGGAGNDTIKGSQAGDHLAGGSGDDVIEGQNGVDIIYGDSGFNVDPITRTLLVPTTENNPQTNFAPQDKLIAGKDQIKGQDGDDIIFGDHGVVIQDVPPSETNLFNQVRDSVVNGVSNPINEKLLTVGKVDRLETAASSNGDDDQIEGGTGSDRIFGGNGNDTIAGGTEHNIILGDLGFIDYVKQDGDRTDIDEISSTVVDSDAAIGGDDHITTEEGDDIILGGTGNDNINAKEGDNLVIGDNGRIKAANADTPRFGNQPLTLGTVETTAFDIGGNDTITTGAGNDVILGGDDDDTITTTNGHNIIFGDDGRIIYDSDNNSGDIDLIESISTTFGGGNDSITTGGGNDFIIGGRFDDNIQGGDGNNIVIGDSGKITAATVDQPQENYNGQSMTVGRIETIEPTDGGDDTIVTGKGEDIVFGGMANDNITTNEGNDIILGDNGFVDYVVTDNDPADIDIISTSNPNAGGKDTITAGSGNDIVMGGTDDDTISGNEGNDLIFGDHGKVEGEIDANLLPLSLNLADTPPNVRPVHPFTWTSIDTQNTDGGGSDLIRGNGGDDIIIGGQGGDRLTGGDGDDDLIGGHNVAGGHDGDDSIDGGTGNDWIAGDNADILRTGDDVSVRMRVLSGENIYDAEGNPLVTNTAQANPSGNEERYIKIFDQSFNPAANTFGNDLIAGGSEDDVIFGQLGNDTIQGDGSVIDDQGNTTIDVRTTRQSVKDYQGLGRDGDDYIEGNGGNDVIFGNLGQDDIIGGSSDQYSLTEPDQRPDGSDTIFGGAGVELVRNNYGDISGECACDDDGATHSNQGHARDADTIMADNANIFRLVGINGIAITSAAFLTFNYDIYDPLWKIIPRAYQFLDYTQGVGSPLGFAGDDLVHGESGDDTIHGMAGNDVLFGEGQDDDIYGGTGYDRIYGGTGNDGILGDDGKIYTSRNGLTESLNNLTVALQQQLIETPGPFIGAVINVTGELHKIVDLVAFESGWSDVIYGGLGCDFLHGGGGDDAISGAEAQILHYHEKPQTQAALGYDPADPLGYDPVTRKFAAYDANNPRELIPDFFLNFDAYIINEKTGEPIVFNGEFVKSNDGKDRIFGGTGNDWLVGGTGNDRMFGGLGDDYINADDNLETNNGLNNQPDSPLFADADFAFGGGGLDVLIANTGGDRLFDWLGEFNSFIVPFSAFGAPTVNRLPSPHIIQFLLDLGKGEGADQSLFEPYGELGLVRNSDPQWQDQNGAPRDPQPGNIGGVQRDTQGGKEDMNNPGDCSCDCQGSIPIIRIEKAINSLSPLNPSIYEDADTNLTAPTLIVGNQITWTYAVSNPGTQSLTITNLRDDAGTPDNPSDDFTPTYISGDINNNQKLDPNEIWLYQAVGTVIAGQYTNIATVTAENSNNQTVTDHDPATYFGTPAGIVLKKSVNGNDANIAPGLNIPEGSTVIWTYEVSNNTNNPVTITNIFDDAGTPSNGNDDFTPTYLSGDSDNNGLLDPGEVWLYQAQGEAIAGQYTNIAKVTAIGGNITYQAQDAANYFGVSTGGNPLVIKKFVNGDDADTPPGLAVAVGTGLIWTYQLSNQGTTPLSITSFVDDRGTPNNFSDDFTPIYLSGDLNNNQLLDPNEIWNYTSVGTIAGNDLAIPGQYTNIATVTALADNITYQAQDTASYFGTSILTAPNISIVKAINAVNPNNPTAYEDANTLPGPILTIGTPITWTYQVFNTGTAPATISSLIDDYGTASQTSDDFAPKAVLASNTIYNIGDLNQNNLIDPSEVWLYTSAGTSAGTYKAVAGQYINTAKVTYTSATGTTGMATDTASYFGTQPRVKIAKAVNVANPYYFTSIEDANNPNTPIYLPVGSTVTWTYHVSNLSNAALRITQVTDDHGTVNNTSDDFTPVYFNGDNNKNGLLDRNDVWIYQATGIVGAGLYTNIARVTAQSTSGTIITVMDDDPASIFGVDPKVRIQKFVNGQDANDPNNPVVVDAGSSVTWTYRVSNDGNVPLTINSVRDDAGTPTILTDDFSAIAILQPNSSFNIGDLDRDGLLDTDEIWEYQATGGAITGLYTNTAKVTATSSFINQVVTDDDTASYFGKSLAIRVEKAVNAVNPMSPTRYEDADVPTGPILTVGTPIVWTYQVFNDGNIPLNLVGLTDSDGFDPIQIKGDENYNYGDENNNGLIDPNEVWLFTSEGVVAATAQLGQRSNTATVTSADLTTGQLLTDEDLAHYFGTPSGIKIVKAINVVNPNNPTTIEDANDATNPFSVNQGSIPVWTYQVMNTGANPLQITSIRDDAATDNTSDDFTPAPVLVNGFNIGDSNQNNLLDTTETWLYTSSGVYNKPVQVGTYLNVAQVVALDTVTNTTVTDDDLAHYRVTGTVITEGRMTGGGSIFTGDGMRVTHGFTLHCSPNVGSDNLQVNFGGNSFHLEQLTSMICYDDPNLNQLPRSAPFDTLVGEGVGRFNNQSGYRIRFTFTDAGEPGKKDFAQIVITDPLGNVVLFVAGNLHNGNHQAHPEN